MTTAQDTNTSAIAAYYRDGTLQTSNIVNAGIPNYSAGLGIGANYSGDYDIGGTYQIYELLLYDSYLTQTDQQKVEGYLAWKWGMQGNLPSDHPYKNAAP
jgi:hypothetical protein